MRAFNRSHRPSPAFYSPLHFLESIVMCPQPGKGGRGGTPPEKTKTGRATLSCSNRLADGDPGPTHPKHLVRLSYPPPSETRERLRASLANAVSRSLQLFTIFIYPALENASQTPW